MKRLTIKGFDFTSDFVASNLQSYPIAEALKKLQAYEDMEEQGRLIELPCKVGDTIYKLCPINLNIKFGDMRDGRVVMKNCHRCAWGGCGCSGLTQVPTAITTIENVSENYILHNRVDFGKRIFLTQKEAENALAKVTE